MKLFHVFVKNIKPGMALYGVVFQMTSTPVEHDHACNILKSLTNYKWRIKYLEPV